MKKQLTSLALALTTACVPAVAFAGGSVLDEINEEIAALSVVDANILDLNLDNSLAGSVDYGHGPGRGYGPRPAPAPAPRPYMPPPPPPRHVVHYAPVRRTEVVVVTDSTPKVTETAVAAAAVSAPERVGSKLGFGLRILGNKQAGYKWYEGNPYTCDENNVAGGIGWYFKYRPVRWISLEFVNDYQFGKIADSEEIYRMPFHVGLQGHIFDYGDFDLYVAAAGGLTYVTFDRDDRPSSEHYYQWGGQFGVGASVLLGGIFELGVDVRYTIDEAPDNHSYWTSDADGYNSGWAVTDYDQSQIVHGVTFALTLGFGL